jgi:ABC-type lipopolysaccharide export system ATPase subunit
MPQDALILEADGFQLSFGDRRILSDVYLRCSRGEVVGILGRNGQGKSCMLQMIHGSRKGECCIRFDKKAVHGAYRQRGLLSFLPQKHFLPMRLPLRQAFLDFGVDIKPFLESFPQYAHAAAYPMSEFSGGSQRLIEIYLVLHCPSSFTLLDEPFSMLSPVAVEKVTGWIRDVKSRKGIILTDHLFHSVLDTCDRLYLLQHGFLRPLSAAAQLEDHGYLRPGTLH